MSKRNRFTKYKKRKSKAFKNKKSKQDIFVLAKDDPFYKSKEWIEVREIILETYGRKCMKCGTMDAIMNVDHIKPKRFFPKLKLDLNNLQVLCSSCNKEKGNKDHTDYRPDVVKRRNKIKK